MFLLLVGVIIGLILALAFVLKSIIGGSIWLIALILSVLLSPVTGWLFVIVFAAGTAVKAAFFVVNMVSNQKGEIR